MNRLATNPGEKCGLGLVIVNYNTSALTLECLRSVAESPCADQVRVLVIDNASDAAQQATLRNGLGTAAPAACELMAMHANVGFAAACNRGIEALLADARVDAVLLLNNDAVLLDDGLGRLLQRMNAADKPDMLAARMHRFDAPDRVDSLGIAMYASALASNRVDLRDRLVGPTGGLALYSRGLLEALRDRHGTIFDERFFCYAEDTDVALRARLLGFECGFVDDVIALHHGQASSGGGFSDFVLYHGIRNSIWTMVKDVPWPWLVLLSPLIAALHGGIVVRHSLDGRREVVWRLYRDAIKGLPAMWRSRRTIQRSRELSWWQFRRLLTPRFYDRAYLRMAWRELWGRR